MAEIKLYFTTGNELVSHIIRGAELGFPYSHVGCVFEDGLLSAHIDGGVNLRASDTEDPWTEWADVTIPSSDGQLIAHRAWLTSQIGKKYDMDAIAQLAEGALTAKVGHEGWPNGWICSSLQFEALFRVGLIGWEPQPLAIVTPQALMFACAAIPGSRKTIRTK